MTMKDFAAAERLDEWLELREEEMLEDIGALVEIPSISGEPEGNAPFGRECAKVLEKSLEIGRKCGFSGEIARNVCTVLSWGTGEKRVGIWGHLDVVPEGGGWIYPPFSCTRKGDFIIGRGVQDNKGPSVAVLYALRYLKEQGFEPSVTFQVILGCNEEAGMEDVRIYLEENPAPDMSFVTDCSYPVCHGEKGHCRVTLGSAGLSGGIRELSGGSVVNIIPADARAELSLSGGGLETVTAKGMSGHAAFPQGSRNAIGILAGKVLGEKERYALSKSERDVFRFLQAAAGEGFGKELGIDCADELSGSLTASGTVVRIQDGGVRLDMDIRYPVTVKTEDFMRILRDSAGKYGFAVLDLQDSAPTYTDPDSPLVKKLMEAYREVKKDGKEPYVMGGGTYARKIPNAVGFGPGQDMEQSALGLPPGHGNCHGADEAQSISALKEAVRIYVRALIRLNAMCV